jgi:ectoine hydroxylase-related dioxygenase (phytanoyl-CoA dioxygenase family)
MRRFLDEAGYLIVRDVFPAREVQALKHAVAGLREAASKGDGRSWWAPDAHGGEVLCRITYAGDRAPLLAGLFDDARIGTLVEIAGGDFHAATDRVDGVTVLFKNPDVVGGLSDLPWHRDCGLGGHSVMCPLLIVGIHLDPMTPETGELRVLPGSWKASCHFFDVANPDAPKGVGLAAGAGDCTLHYGDLMHAAPPPTGRGAMRTTLYLTYMPTRAFEVIGPGQAYNDVLLTDGTGRVKHLYEVSGTAN